MNQGLLNQGRPMSPVTIPVKNADTVSIAKGTPVVFSMSGTRDGFDIVKPSNSNALQSAALLAGILCQDLAIGAIGAAAVRGPVDDVPYMIRTRAGTTGTDSWATEAAISIGQALSLDTVNNAFETASAAQAEQVVPAICAAETVATVAGSATSTANALTVSTGTLKVFLRLM